jgi:hypothetical protein
MDLRTIFLCLTLLPGVACKENFETYYIDAVAARDAKAIERGWIPAFLPSSATKIYECHNIDTNQCWGRFSFAEDDIDWRDSLAEVAPSLLLEKSMDVAWSTRWWPSELRGSLSAGALEKAGYRFYTYEGERTLVAVNRKKGQVFFKSKRRH